MSYPDIGRKLNMPRMAYLLPCRSTIYLHDISARY
jgi:hypothetical protein